MSVLNFCHSPLTCFRVKLSQDRHYYLPCPRFANHYLLFQDIFSSGQFSRSVMSDSETPWTAERQASQSITNSRSPPKPMSIESMMPSSHLILCHPLLLLPLIFPSIRVFSNESALCIRWPKYWSYVLQNTFSFRKLCFSPRGYISSKNHLPRILKPISAHFQTERPS